MKTVLFAAVAMLGATTANAATVVFDFDTLTVGNNVGAYNGAVFSNFAVQSGFGPTSAPNFAYNAAATAGFDYAPGFTSLSFTSGVFSNTTVQVFSGLGGAGSLLGSIIVTNPPADPNAFGPISVAFSGTGKSVVVTGATANFAWDDVSINGVVPEPQSWAMMIAGFGLVGAMARRRRTVVAA